METETELFEWSDEYEIGVKSIDDAHRRLFSVVNRIFKNLMDDNYEKNEKICVEAIKYLKDYTIKHFADEEAYQLSIRYPGYKVHKRIHDNMRDVVIPALEQEAEFKGYSREAIEHLTGACAGWLAAHVLVEDQAITGKTRSKWQNIPDKQSEARLESIVSSYIEGLFRLTGSIANQKYVGYKLNNIFCYGSKFTAEDGTMYSVATAVEEPLLKRIALNVVDEKLLAEKEVMLPLVVELLKSFNADVIMAFSPSGIKHADGFVVRSADFYKLFSSEYPTHSTLWRTAFGYLAFCVKVREPARGFDW
ncbi:MAG: bacteriohemerythrin [Bacteroides sp.]|nr:bacteriohemerythrin [Eubacterium sp.]MCM1419316.1 bacteriohemerythrin [Roseburia sp.]MCM1463156.1 bacteriohemerythrin [Bacteroides sp.]